MEGPSCRPCFVPPHCGIRDGSRGVSALRVAGVGRRSALRASSLTTHARSALPRPDCARRRLPPERARCRPRADPGSWALADMQRPPRGSAGGSEARHLVEATACVERPCQEYRELRIDLLVDKDGLRNPVSSQYFDLEGAPLSARDAQDQVAEPAVHRRCVRVGGPDQRHVEAARKRTVGHHKPIRVPLAHSPRHRRDKVGPRD